MKPHLCCGNTLQQPTGSNSEGPADANRQAPLLFVPIRRLQQQ